MRAAVNQLTSRPSTWRGYGPFIQVQLNPSVCAYREAAAVIRSRVSFQVQDQTAQKRAGKPWKCDSLTHRLTEQGLATQRWSQTCGLNYLFSMLDSWIIKAKAKARQAGTGLLSAPGAGFPLVAINRLRYSSSHGAISPFITFDYHKSICDKL